MGRLSPAKPGIRSASEAGVLAACIACLAAAGCAADGTGRAGSSEGGARSGGMQKHLPDHFRSADTLTAHGMVTVLLDRFHRAAATGDFDAYFGCLTGDAVFLGTDPAERWSRDEFAAFSRPYFDGVEAWTYEPVERHLMVGSGQTPDIVWFDEILWNDKYGQCRGTGVAVRSPVEPDAGFGGWRIARYSLSLLVPNERVPAAMEAIGEQRRPD